MVREAVVIAALAALGCSSESKVYGGSGGGSSGGPVGQGGSTSTGAGGGGEGGAGGTKVLGPCALAAPGCKPETSDCIALADNREAAVFGLRMSQLRFHDPAALKTGVISTVLSQSVALNYEACPRDTGGDSVFGTGTGTLSWLLQFDTGAGTLKTGGARPVADPLAGYCFAASPFQPATAQAVIGADGAFATASAVDIVLPWYLDAQGQNVILLPLHGLRFQGGLSADHNCVGVYNAEGLSPDNACAPDPDLGVFSFVDGGTLAGFIGLAEADEIEIEALQHESLCVLLTGQDNGQTPKRCPRDGSNEIAVKGDWCSVTNSADGCADAFHVQGTFAASGVAIQGACK